jgi:hypothetical protein
VTLLGEQCESLYRLAQLLNGDYIAGYDQNSSDNCWRWRIHGQRFILRNFLAPAIQAIALFVFRNKDLLRRRIIKLPADNRALHPEPSGFPESFVFWEQVV